MSSRKQVGDQVLAPDWTDFRQRVFYQTYDVTSLLASGENVLGAYLAPGWYATPLEWKARGIITAQRRMRCGRS